jgi:antitoxin PrlF
MAETVRMDSKGRISLPRSLRERRGYEEGTVFFWQEDEMGIRLMPAINPFDLLAEEAVSQYRTGETRNLRDYAREHDIDLDEP